MRRYARDGQRRAWALFCNSMKRKCAGWTRKTRYGSLDRSRPPSCDWMVFHQTFQETFPRKHHNSGTYNPRDQRNSRKLRTPTSRSVTKHGKNCAECRAASERRDWQATGQLQTANPPAYETNETAGSSRHQPHAPSPNTEAIAPSAEVPPKGETGKPPGQLQTLVTSPKLSLTIFHKPLSNRFVVLDFETTGLSPANGARIIEVSAREIIDGNATKELSSFVDPNIDVPPEITALTGITSAMIRGAPSSSVVMRELVSFIGRSPIIAHNASFDLKFLKSEAVDLRTTTELRAICTLLLSRRIFPGKNSYRLGAIIAELGIAIPSKLHRASADTYVTALLFEQICKHTKQKCGGRDIDFPLLDAMQRQKIATAVHWLERQSPKAPSRATEPLTSQFPPNG